MLTRYLNKRAYYLALVFVLIYTLPCISRAKLQGYVAQGNTTLTISGGVGTIPKKVQGSFPGATVTIYLSGTLSLATLYADNAGTPKANPFTASLTDASWFAYVDNGRYDVRFSGTGITIPFVVGDVIAFDQVEGLTEYTAPSPAFYWEDLNTAPGIYRQSGYVFRSSVNNDNTGAVADHIGYFGGSMTSVPNTELGGYLFFPNITRAAAGVHPIYYGVGFAQPADLGGTATATEAATVLIESDPAAAVVTDGVSKYALWVNAGNVRFDGKLLFNTGDFGIENTAGNLAVYSDTGTVKIGGNGTYSLIVANNSINAVADQTITKAIPTTYYHDTTDAASINYGIRSFQGELQIYDADTTNYALKATKDKTTIDGSLTVSLGDMTVSQQGYGVLLKSPDGTKCARISIDNAGALTTTPVACW